MPRFWFLLILFVLVTGTLGVGVFLFLAMAVNELDLPGHVTSEKRSDALEAQTTTAKSDRR